MFGGGRVGQKLFRRGQICGVVAAATAADMARQLRRAIRQVRTIELRLDWLKNEAEIRRFLLWLGRQKSKATLIATCRRRLAGGRFTGSISKQLGLLARAAAAGCQWCDVEIETAQQSTPADLRRRLHPAMLIISFHDFRRTPKNLAGITRRLARRRGDAIKIATHCRSVADSIRVLKLSRPATGGPTISVPMGEAGLPARILALREGSALAYAALENSTAPGQLSLTDMSELYRADRLNRRTRIFAVIGNPIAHSLSPRLHNAGFQARRINAVYLPFLVQDLKDFLRNVRPFPIAGFSVTLPHKQSILRHLDDCDPLAARIGAINTVVHRNGHLYGLNTDYVGVLRALEQRTALRGARILIYGAGGAARAVAFALAEAVAAVHICARRIREAEKLARAAGAIAIERAALRKISFDAIINATPVGMHPHAGASPLSASELNCSLVFDLIYRPRQTRLLQLAAARGIETVSGVEMFLAQGIAQWEIWMERRAPEAAMRRAVLQALRREERTRIQQ